MTLKLPFTLPNDKLIIYADPSSRNEFVIRTPLIKAKDAESFLQNVSPYWRSVLPFSSEEIFLFESTDKSFVLDDPLNRFIFSLKSKGFPLELIKGHVFKVESSIDQSVGLLFFDCNQLPRCVDDKKSLKICFCPSAAFTYAEFNYDYFLYSFDVIKVILFFIEGNYYIQE